MTIQSTSHYELRDSVWATLVEQVHQDDPTLGDVTERLVALIDENKGSALFKHNKLADKVHDILPDDLSADQKFKLSNIMTLVAHLSRSTSMVAAQNDMKTPDGALTDSTMGSMVKQLKASGLSKPKQIIHHLKGIAMDNVFTAHPTYIGDLEFAKELRDLDFKIQRGDEHGVSEKLRELLHANPLVEGRLKAQDETVYMRHYLKNCYRQVKYVYEHIDQAMITNGIKDYDPSELKLDLTFQSWGSSGDKDGNKNVTFQSLRDAIHTHRECVVNGYVDDMRRIVEPDFNENGRRADIISDALRQEFVDVSEKLHNIVEYGSNSNQLPEGNSIDDTLAALRKFADNATQELTAEQTSPVAIASGARGVLDRTARYALGLRRTIDTFGLHLGHIEFRETADELKFVLNHVIDSALLEKALGDDAPSDDAYSQLSPELKERVTDYMLAHWSELDKTVQANIATSYAHVKSDAKTRRFEYADSGAEKDGTPKDNHGVFVHTLERLKLAARNPDMVKGQVLAEATEPVQVKEMLLLLKATGNDKTMRIIPLFEDPDVLKEEDFRETMKKLNHDPALLTHNIDVSLREWDEKVAKELRPAISNDLKMEIRRLPNMVNDNDNTQRMYFEKLNGMIAEETRSHANDSAYKLSDVINIQIQLAHSDNARRGGTAGARARIYKAHEVARKSAQNLNIGVHFFEGGSHTDSFRMGVRSYRSLVNMYNNHNFMKCTVQGMDLAQIFSNPSTIEAFIEENIANSARVLRDQTIRHTLPQKRAEQYVNRTLYDQDAMINPIIDSVKRYREDYFGSEENPNIPLGNIMAQVFDYQGNKDSGTIGSRSGGRSGSTDLSLYINPVKETRTIGYSETFQHGRLNPNYIGAGELRTLLVGNGLLSKEATSQKELAFKQEFAGVPDKRKLNALYKHSPFLRDAIDRTAYAVATTDFDKVWDNAMHDYSSGEKGGRILIIGTREEIEQRGKDNQTTEIIEKRPDPSDLEALADNKENSAESMLAWLELEYRGAAAMVLEAIGKKEVNLETIPTRKLTSMVRDELKMYQDTFAMQDVLMETADAIHHSTPKSVRDSAVGTVINGLNKALHNVRDMATLVRPPFQAELINQGIKKRPEIEAGHTRGV